MVSVIRMHHLPSEIPVVGCELTPYVLLRLPYNTATTDDVPESSPLEGHFLKYRWYRVESDKKVAICSVHSSKEATLQCIGCLKTKVPITESYHCSTTCYTDAWQHHRVLHERVTSAEGNDEDDDEEEELLRLLNSLGSVLTNVSSSVCVETLVEVGRSKTYTPMADDLGHVLKFECVVVNAETKQNVGHYCSILTCRVITAPSPSPRKLIPVSGAVDSPISMGIGSFTVLSYNILADTYASSSDVYSYCPAWALSWTYRRQNLLKEIVNYHADIVCLQEVQNDHFYDFFAPELDKHGYQALFKRKNNEVFVGNTNTLDGCATFYKRDRFSQVKKYEVEFNKAAQSSTEDVIPVPKKKIALNRLVKDNVALVVVLEAKFDNQAGDIPEKRQLLCVANTHVNIPHELKDVKLWQVHSLLKGLEIIAAKADIPMLVCGDFNTVPASAPHLLLALGMVDPMHPDLMVDPLGMLRPHTKLTHQLPLVSAYSSFARMGDSFIAEQQRRRMDPSSNEPLFTNCTRDFIGTPDYIFYTADTLNVESLLELLDVESLRKHTALPSPEWSSDHIALLAEFRCIPRPDA